MTEAFERYQASRPFKVIFCRASDPESKGKVENTIKYTKATFSFKGLLSALRFSTSKLRLGF
jgi:transposase